MVRKYLCFQVKGLTIHKEEVVASYLLAEAQVVRKVISSEY